MDTGVTIGFQIALLWVNFACIALVGAIVYARNRSVRFQHRDLAIGAGLFVLAMALRLAVSPHTLIHENSHGYEYLQTAFTGQGYPLHGAGYYAFYRLLTLVFGSEPQVVFGCNAVLGSMSAVLLAFAGTVLVGDRKAGWFAGFVYAIWPASLRIAASESMFPLAIFVGLATLAVWLRALRSGDRWLYVLAGLLLASTVQIRPVMALWPFVLAISSISVPGWRAQVKTPWPWVAACLSLLLSSGWMIFRIQEVMAHGVPGVVDLSPVRAVVLLFSMDNLLWNGRWTPVTALCLAVVGLAVLFRRSWRFALVLLASGALLSWFALAPSVGAEVSQLRLQSPIHLFVAIAAGAGASALCNYLPERLRVVGVAVLVVCLLVSSGLRFDAVRERYNPHVEFRFLEEAISSIPPECMVVTAPKFMADGILMTEFPYWWLDGRPLTTLDHVEDPENIAGLWPCVVWYRGLTCYAFTWQERTSHALPADGLRAECAEVENAHVLTPLETGSFPNRPYLDYLKPEREVLEFGVYRVGAGDAGTQR